MPMSQREGRYLIKSGVKDNLLLGAYTIRDEKIINARLNEMYELFPRLKEREHQKAETLSGGEQQMLAIARD